MSPTPDPGRPRESDESSTTNLNDVGTQMSEEVADMRHATAEENSEELETSSDSDWDDGDEVIARGYPRNHLNLEKYGFRPVWTYWARDPGEIPDDIRECLDENGKRDTAQIVGPLRSLAWLAGLDELIEAIDHPAYTIRDEIEVVPQGADISFPVNYHWEQGNIQHSIWRKITGEPTPHPNFSQRFVPRVRYEIPACVTETPTELNL